MTDEFNGSKPGPIHQRPNSLKRVNTLPSAEFAIPPADSLGQSRLHKCHSHQTHCKGAQEKSEGHEGQEGPDGDEESLSSCSSEAYPEGGLQAWLVVLGGFAGTTVGFGLM